jgi:hypothetical protein
MENTKLKEVEIPQISTSAEDTLTTVGNVILVLGILATIILAFTTVFVEVEVGWHKESRFNPMGLALTVGTLLSTLATWAVLRVIANISLRLKAIQETMPRRMMTDAEVKVVEEVEQKLAENKVQSDFSVGEIVLYKGNKYPIENISPSTGKICINRGFIAGYAWVFPEEVTKVEE